MSLYNALFGTNPATGLLLAMLGIDRNFPPRFRDCYLDGERIVIYTRTGGGNRDEYEAQNDAMHALPGFVSDEDDDFDSTYAHFSYRIPEKFLESIEALRNIGGAGKDPRLAWKDMFDKLNDPAKKDDPEVLAVLEKSKPLIEKLNAALKSEGPSVIEI